MSLPVPAEVWPLPLRARLRIIRRVRAALAAEAQELAAIARPERPALEVIVSEVVPAAAACRWLERNARRVLRPQKFGLRGRPVWLAGLASEIHREPVGTVLVISPGNYPLLLPGIPVLQALAAGNRVLLKPAPGREEIAARFHKLLAAAGLPDGVLTVLGSAVEDARRAIAGGVDKVIFTGSAVTGAALLSDLAPHLTPAVLELSGNDAVIVRADADIALVADAILWGLALNSGRTCIAPRRIFVHASAAGPLRQALAAGRAGETAALPPAVLKPLQEALAAAAQFVTGSSDAGPVILEGVPPDSPLWREDYFAPVSLLRSVGDDDEAVALASDCPYALAASVFSRDVRAARELAARLPAGSVAVNDIIAPTVDPRVPFGGRARSGYGTTRAAEGLLEMTTVKVIAVRRGKIRPHLMAPKPADLEIFTRYLEAVHIPGIRRKLSAWLKCAAAAVRRNRK